MELCLLDYDFHILSDSFLVHKGIKTRGDANAHKEDIRLNEKVINYHIKRELAIKHGRKRGCFPGRRRK